MNYSESFVKEHIEKWVNAWNNYDLKALLSIYSDDIELSSPKVKVEYILKGNNQRSPTKESLRNIGLML
jgi:ketosteroid isomerase-like protein